jgi:hypothetical protein
MEIVRDGHTSYVGMDGNDIKEALMRELKIQATGWSLWKDGRKVEERFWKVDRYTWKSDDESIEIIVDDQEILLMNRGELRDWLRKEYPEDVIVKLSSKGKPLDFRRVQSGGQYWTISREDNRQWKCLVNHREFWLSYRPS